MFYEVKVFDPQGQLKKVVSSKKLSNRFWRSNDKVPSYYEESHVRTEDWSTKDNTQATKVSPDDSL